MRESLTLTQYTNVTRIRSVCCLRCRLFHTIHSIRILVVVGFSFLTFDGRPILIIVYIVHIHTHSLSSSRFISLSLSHSHERTFSAENSHSHSHTHTCILSLQWLSIPIVVQKYLPKNTHHLYSYLLLRIFDLVCTIAIHVYGAVYTAYSECVVHSIREYVYEYMLLLVG